MPVVTDKLSRESFVNHDLW